MPPRARIRILLFKLVQFMMSLLYRNSSIACLFKNFMNGNYLNLWWIKSYCYYSFELLFILLKTSQHHQQKFTIQSSGSPLILRSFYSKVLILLQEKPINIKRIIHLQKHGLIKRWISIKKIIDLDTNFFSIFEH